VTTDINMITAGIEEKFGDIEQTILSGETFNQWRGSFEVKKTYIKKENADIKCDLDIRLVNWPEGVYVKVYKHKALAVLPYVKDEAVVREHLKVEPIPCKFWRDSFYFSHADDLDEGRYVLRDGNLMTELESEECLAMLKRFIVEIEEIMQAHQNAL